MAFLQNELIHLAHYFCAFFKKTKLRELLEIGSGSQMVFEKPSKRCALEEVVSAVTRSFHKKRECDSVMEKRLG